MSGATHAQLPLIDRMTLEQKVAQMFMVTLHGSVLTEDGAAFLQRYQPGLVVLFTSNAGTPDAVTRLTNSYQQTITAAGGVPLLIAVDQEGGVVTRLPDGFTMFPAPLLIGAAGPELAYQTGLATAEELAAVGVNMNLAPVTDLETNPDNPIITRRSFGSDPNLVGETVAAYIQGSQSINVLATAKHFPGHGDTSDDSHGTLPILNLSREVLESRELVPFQRAIDAGVAAVMVAHIDFTALDDVPNLPASLSPEIVTGLLRDDMGFDGLIMTDAMDMNAVDLYYNFYDAVVMAVNAGVDVVSMGPGIGLPIAEQAIQRIVAEVNAGNISESRIDESVERILATKDRFEVLSWQALDPATVDQRMNMAAHADLFARLYQAGATVAIDRNNLVPVPADKSVALIFLATRYQIQQECALYRSDIRWVGVADNPTAEQIGWATGAAALSDVVIVFTQDAIRNVEQQALVNALPPEKTVAVALWSPYDWQTFPQVSAYMATYTPARPAVPAACAILFGAQPATGRLSITLGPELLAGSHDDS